MEPTLSSTSSKPSSPGWLAWAFHPIISLLKFKLLYLALLINALLSFPTIQDYNMYHSNRQQWTTDVHLTFESHFVAWDSEHYLHISEKGYQADTGVCAFYPLWPMAVRYFSPVVGGSNVWGGMVLANVVSLVGIYLFFRLVRRRFGNPTAWLAVILLLSFPGSLFYQFNYSEGLFLLLLMLLCVALDEGRPRLALGAAFFLPLTRGVGIFCVFPLLLYVCRHNEGVKCFLLGLVGKQSWLPDRLRAMVAAGVSPAVEGGVPPPGSSLEFCGPMDKSATSPVAGTVFPPGGTPWLVVTPLAGWAVYLFLMWHWTGNPFEGFAAQRFWGVQSIGNLFDLPKFLVGFVTPTTWHEFNGSVLDRCAFLVCLYMLPIVWRLDKVWFVWVLVLGVVPAMSGTFVSFTRFASVVFPVFVALAVLLAKRERWFLRFLTIGLFGTLHVWLVWRFVNYHWAG